MAALIRILVVVIALAFMPPVLGLNEGDRISFSYSGDAQITGSWAGSCAMHGAVFDPDQSIAFAAEEVELERVQIWTNKTRARPGEPEEVRITSPMDYHRKVVTLDLEPGSYTVTSRSDGVLSLLPPDSVAAEAPDSFLVFEAGDSSLKNIGKGLSTASFMKESDSDGPMDVLMGGLSTHSGRFPHGTRATTFAEDVVEARGNGTIHLRDGLLEGQDAWIELPEYERVVDVRSDPLNGAEVRTLLLEEAFIKLHGFRIVGEDIAATWGCTHVDAVVSGQFSALGVSGEIEANDVKSHLDGKVLTISGQYRLQETAANDRSYRVDAAASGEFRLVGIDFQVVSTRVGEIGLLPVMGLVTLILAALVVTGKTVVPVATSFMLRIRHRNGAHDLQQVIISIVEERGAIWFHELMTMLQLGEGTLRYHRDVLLKRKQVRSLRYKRRIVLHRLDWPREKALQNLLHADPRLKLVELFMDSGLSRPEVAKRIALETGNSKRSAYNYIKEYERISRLGSTKERFDQ